MHKLLCPLDKCEKFYQLWNLEFLYYKNVWKNFNKDFFLIIEGKCQVESGPWMIKHLSIILIVAWKAAIVLKASLKVLTFPSLTISHPPPKGFHLSSFYTFHSSSKLSKKKKITVLGISLAIRCTELRDKVPLLKNICISTSNKALS